MRRPRSGDPQSSLPTSSAERFARRGDGRSCSSRLPSSAVTRRAGNGGLPVRLPSWRDKSGKPSSDEGADSGLVLALRRTSEQLEHLRAFAVPVVEELSRWPSTATWGEWLDVVRASRASRAAKACARAPRARRSAADVGHRSDRPGRVATRAHRPPADASNRNRRRGVSVVCSSGRHSRRAAAASASCSCPGSQSECFRRSRVRIRCCSTGCAAPLRRRFAPSAIVSRASGCCCSLRPARRSERLYVSYPRIELTESRARVPSFYALDVMRAATGRIPDYEWLEQRARETGKRHARMAGAVRPDEAIDDLEHDLASLRQLLDERDRGPREGIRTLPSQAERVSSTVGHRPLGAGRAAMVGQ